MAVMSNDCMDCRSMRPLALSMLRRLLNDSGLMRSAGRKVASLTNRFTSDAAYPNTSGNAHQQIIENQYLNPMPSLLSSDIPDSQAAFRTNNSVRTTVAARAPIDPNNIGEVSPMKSAAASRCS